jgi:hypothetical protein
LFRKVELTRLAELVELTTLVELVSTKVTIVVATFGESSGFVPSPSFFFAESKPVLLSHAQISGSFCFSEGDLAEFGTEFSDFTDVDGKANACGDFFVDNDFRSDFLGDDDRFNEFDSLLEVNRFSDGNSLGNGDLFSDFDLLSEGLRFEVRRFRLLS